jgi:hypothetical protein
LNSSENLSHREMEGRKICSTCHDGAMKHGVDNSSFCSNPACHDTVWPGLDLAAKRAE